MKTNFLFKIIVLLIVCVSLNSCTVEELLNADKTQSTVATAAKDGEPIIKNPR